MSFINATQALQKVLNAKEPNKYMMDYQQGWFIENYNTLMWLIIWCDWTDDSDLRLTTYISVNGWLRNTIILTNNSCAGQFTNRVIYCEYLNFWTQNELVYLLWLGIDKNRQRLITFWHEFVDLIFVHNFASGVDDEYIFSMVLINKERWFVWVGWLGVGLGVGG